MGTRHDLRRAQRAGDHVRLRRSIKGADPFHGIVLQVGRKWCLVANVLDGVTHDGFEVIRVADVRSVRRERHQGFTRRALGEPPSHAPLPLDRTRDLMAALAATHPLLGIHTERWRVDVFYVGVFVHRRRRWSQVHEIKPGARWCATTDEFRNRGITRLTVDSAYLRELHRQAPPRPSL